MHIIKQLKNNSVQIFLLILYLISGYIYSKEVIDRISLQWLYLSILNTFSSSYLILYHFNKIKNFKLSSNNVFLGLFTLWACLSIIYGINQSESIVNASRWVNVLIGLFNVNILLKFFNNRFKLISTLISLMLIFEIFFTLKAYFSIIDYVTYDFSLANNLRGATANKNVTAASFITKLPFLLYLILINKKTLYRVLYSILLFATIYSLFLLGSRATYVSFSLIVVLISILTLYISIKHKEKFKIIYKKNLGIIILIIFSSFSLSIFTLKESNASVTNRILTISTNDTSTKQRLRYYNHAADHFFNNPIFGVGIGNWKIKSVDYDRVNMTGYTVPYHVHNDFLQFAAELGLIGLLLYFLIFLNIGLKTIKFTFFDKISLEKKIMFFILLLSTAAYFVDSNLNFPYARVINLILFICLINLFDDLEKNRI